MRKLRDVVTGLPHSSQIAINRRKKAGQKARLIKKENNRP